MYKTKYEKMMKSIGEDIEKVFNLALKLHKNEQEATDWMYKKTDVLFGKTPLEVCLEGNTKHLIDWLENKVK